MKKLGLVQSVYGKDGYTIDLKMSPADLAEIRQIIHTQWIYRLQLLVPDKVHLFYNAGIEKYHEHAHLIDHAKAWPKTSRVMSPEAVARIRKMDFFRSLEAEFGDLQIADEEKLGWENFYWRLVRPGNMDFGTLHADDWFVQLGYYGAENDDNTREKVKIWIALHTTPGKNGLVVVPHSHTKKDWKWHGEEKGGMKKPVIDEDLSKLDIQLLPTEPGRAVVFHYDLLHGGAENQADTTRVSMEFTFLVRKDVLKRELSAACQQPLYEDS